jgi:hypothetical protein
MPKTVTGTFFDIDPDTWREFVSVPDSAAEAENRPASQAGPEPPAATLAVASSQAAQDYAPFWQAHLDLVNTWARYQSAKRLEINNSYPETEHRVSHVVDGYWSGSPSKLHETVEYRSSLVESALRYCEQVCSQYGVEPVSREWLYDNLLDGSDYASYRGKIKRRMSRNKPAVSMKVL